VLEPRHTGGRLGVRGAARKLARATSAYLAGIGTSGSLLAGAALMFILASALVAFRGWPHLGAQPAPGEVIVSQSRVPPSVSPSARRLQLVSAAPIAGAPAGPLAGAALPAAGPGGGRAGRPSPRRSIGQPASTSIPVGVPSVGGVSAPAVPSCVPSCAPTQPAIPGPAPAQLAQPAVQQVASSLGGVVSSTGRGVGSTVHGTTSKAAGAVRPASPTLAGAANGAGSGADSTLAGVTQTVAGALSGIGKH
jgi:hypothetical protein